ncbi:MAG: hypothetical protein CM15mP74_20000 [Halieaceae bacterium]|nr:MAG: hypothetical protein CM15mP74_20000 [Halieaceae bacterium]
MVIQPKVRGFLCTTTHPTGCFENVRRQAEHVRSKGVIAEGPKAGAGVRRLYWLRISLPHYRGFGSGASTLASSSRNRAPTASPVPPAGITRGLPSVGGRGRPLRKEPQW